MYSILVVDDEEELRKQVVSILSAHGYAVDEACDGLDAASKLATHHAPGTSSAAAPRWTSSVNGTCSSTVAMYSLTRRGLIPHESAFAHSCTS